MSEQFSVLERVSYDANHIRGMTTAGLFEFLGKLSVNADNAQAIGVCFRELKARFLGTNTSDALNEIGAIVNCPEGLFIVEGVRQMRRRLMDENDRMSSHLGRALVERDKLQAVCDTQRELLNTSRLDADNLRKCTLDLAESNALIELMTDKAAAIVKVGRQRNVGEGGYKKL